MKDEDDFRASCGRIMREPAFAQLRSRIAGTAHSKLRNAKTTQDLWQAQGYAWASDTFFDDVKAMAEANPPKRKAGVGA